MKGPNINKWAGVEGIHIFTWTDLGGQHSYIFTCAGLRIIAIDSRT